MLSEFFFRSKRTFFKEKFIFKTKFLKNDSKSKYGPPRCILMKKKNFFLEMTFFVITNRLKNLPLKTVIWPRPDLGDLEWNCPKRTPITCLILILLRRILFPIKDSKHKRTPIDLCVSVELRKYLIIWVSHYTTSPLPFYQPPLATIPPRYLDIFFKYLLSEHVPC